jgi:hypothetical protein
MKKLLIIPLLFFSLILSATNYYVKTGGSDAANGLTDGTAWEHHPWMSTWTGSVVLAAGDIVYMNRGDTWSISNPVDAYITVGQSGSAGNPITTTWYGSGAKPIIKITTDDTYTNVILGYGKSYITFDNLDIQHFEATRDGINGQNGIMFGLDVSNNVPHDWTITNCDIHNIPSIAIYGYDDSYNITVGNVSATSTATVSAYSNQIYDCGYGGIILMGRDPVTNHSHWNVYYNYIHDIDASSVINEDAYAIGFSSNPNNTIGHGFSTGWPNYATAKYNYVSNVPGHDGIDCHGGTYIYIQDNYVYNCFQPIAVQASSRTNYESAILNHVYIERNIVESKPSPTVANIAAVKVMSESASKLARNVFVNNNTIFYTTRPTVETTSWGICAYNSDSIFVSGNHIYNGTTGAGGVGIGTSSSGTIANYFIENNYIDNWDVGIYFPSNNVIGDVKINSNVVRSYTYALMMYDGNLVSGVDVTLYNNDLFLVNSVNTLHIIHLQDVTIDVGATLTIRNNIIGVTTTNTYGYYLLVGTISGTLVSDYNLFWNDTKGDSWYYAGAAHTFATWQGHGYDLNSINATDPLLTNGSGLYNLVSDFHLKSSSPAINTGIGVGLTKDYESYIIQGLPDIGAYEFGVRMFKDGLGNHFQLNGKTVYIRR